MGDEHPFGNCFVRLRLNIRKGKSSSNTMLAVQIGTPAECDTFVACIRACAKHQRAALMASREEQPFDEASGLSVPSTVLRAVGSMATYLRDGGRADTEWHPISAGENRRLIPWPSGLASHNGASQSPS